MQSTFIPSTLDSLNLQPSSNRCLSSDGYGINLRCMRYLLLDSYKVKSFLISSIYLMECLTKVYKFFCCVTDPVFPQPYTFSFGNPGD